MFNSVRGKITEKLGDSVYILCNGVEWDISVPGTDIAKLPPIGEEGRVFTWLYHRDDLMKLYGFASEERRSTFLELLKVEGIGPKGAIKILGGIDQDELEKALETEDLARLEAVPGLGKKTAQKMILALKGKLVVAKAIPDTPYAELAEALAGMGYDRRAAAEALSRAEKEISPDIKGAEREKLLFKEAIVYLSNSA
ncbi:MAG: Holliday junction branch migration protein RuvA [Treponema sp.]|jgi:Holliday junction DNA helicase RuvA|nr:Holliday junction branch migration protein RuvA [Treponema sp.]